MAYTTIIYGDNKYYLLRYYSTKTNKPFEILEIQDKTDKLKTIIPKITGFSYGSLFIVDINNSCHCVLLDTYKHMVLSIISNICKSTFSKPKIVGYVKHGYVNDDQNITKLHTILIKNMDNNCNHSYEYLKFDVCYDTVVIKYKQLLNDEQIIYHGCYISVKLDVSGIKFCAFDSGNSFLDIHDNSLKDIHYDATYTTNNSPHKYYINMNGHDDTIRNYQFMIDTKDDCYIRKSTNTYTKFFTMSNNSIVLHDRNNVMILTNNHVVAIVDHNDITQFTLPINSIQYIGYDKVNKLVWTKQFNNMLPTNYKDLIRMFMMCNRLMGKLEEQPLWGQFRIPYGVLSIIFSIIIN